MNEGPNKFYAFRVQKRGLKHYLAKNPNAVIFDEIEYNPNAINYFKNTNCTLRVNSLCFFKQEYKKEINSRYNKKQKKKIDFFVF